MEPAKREGTERCEGAVHVASVPRHVENWTGLWSMAHKFVHESRGPVCCSPQERCVSASNSCLGGVASNGGASPSDTDELGTLKAGVGPK